MSGHWIKLGDTRVRIWSDEQLHATCRLFNLTVAEWDVDPFEGDEPSFLRPTEKPGCPSSGTGPQFG